ncbi:ABC transporter permease [Demequina sp. NBRC 110056]|uniref:ABC transporter permease n=1 Tax=Demequina sp. NBRC 110056 TaxID=1570345 RepID=UPI0009FC38E7|nr:ABC transporter permease [Demequina sp. NBRC 110056]
MSAPVVDAPVAQGPGASPAAPRTKSWKASIGLGVTALVSLLVFGLTTPSGVQTTFTIATSSDFVHLPSLTVPAKAAAVTLSLIALALAGYVAFRANQYRKVGIWLPIVFGMAVMGALLAWAGADRSGTTIQLTGLLTSSLFLAVPLVFGSLAGTLCERSGIINIAIEGQLLAGAFLAALLASMMGNAYVGLIAAPIAGGLVGWLLAVFATKYWVNQIVVGVVLNLLVLGLTSFFFSTLMSDNPSLNQPLGLPRVDIPLLSSIPVIGPVLFKQNLLVYIMYAAVIILQIMLFKSRWGLRVRSVGEHPKAADTVGIKVNRTRVRNTVLGGAIAGLGGAFFTVASGLAFGKEMTAGKGYIALAAMILGRWSPKGALAAALLFGFADALRVQLGIIGSDIPSQFLAMTPYLATIFAVAGLVGHSRPPAAEGTPYKK